MKTFYLKTLGCKTNQIEGQLIAQNLTENGFEQVTSAIYARYYILNSCTVTSHTDKQAFSLIKQARKKNKDLKVVLTGCMAQLAGDMPEGVDILVGNDEKLKIADYLKKSPVKDIFSVEEFHHVPLHNATGTRPFIKIQEGCDNRCSYCIIPYARGNARSNSIENIVEQINFLAQKGFKEVVLTGTHIGQWGKDLGKGFIDLLYEIEKTNIHRYRLGSLYVNEISDEMIELLKSSKKFCPHFHLSLQSMCDKTLKDMNRNYGTQKANILIEKLKNSFRLPFLGCDIIAGFPQESEEDFETTYVNLAKSELSKIHAFPYSLRQGTPAAKMEGQIPEHVKKERTRKLILLSSGLYKNFLNKNMGVEHEVLFEKKSRGQKANSGFTRNYIKVFSENEDADDFKNTLETLTLKTSNLG